MAIAVRRVTADDWPEMKRIRLLALATEPRAFGATLEQESAFPDQLWIDRARASAASREVATWIAEDDAGRALGMMGAHVAAGGARLFGTWVDPSARGAGLGGRLLDAVLGWIEEVAPGAAVRLCVNPEFAAAVRLYETRGFARTGPSPPIRALRWNPGPGDGSAGRAMRPWLAFGACGAIWGSTFLVISIGNDALAPVWAATLRLALAAVLLSAWTLARGQALPRGAALRAALGYGVGQFGVNLPLLYWGEKLVPSGVSAVLYATIPFTSALAARALRVERLTAGKVLGALIAFGGVALLFSASLRRHIPIAGFAAILAGATSASIGTTLLKRGPRQDPFAANAVGCAAGAILAAVASAALGERHAFPGSARAAWPLIYLTVAGSLGAYVILAWLLSRWPVTRTSYITVIVPVIALGLGAAVRHEPLGPGSLAGTALIVGGLLVGMRPGRAAH